MNYKQAVVLLNMGGARNKDELKVFLTNMFNDNNILTIKNDLFRSIIASLIVFSRTDKAWENYEQIGGKSPLHELTDKLIQNLQSLYPDIFFTTAMRYTSPFAQTAIAKIEQYNIKDVVLLPLYPQYSTTTTKSSVEDFIAKANNKFKISVIEPFYKNLQYNQAICDEIIYQANNHKDYHIIFSAHGLPQKVVDKGDPYETQLQEQINILKKILLNDFLSVNLAYQSKVGPMKWLEPSLETMLENFKNQKVIIYPISFIIDNSETVFELSIEYKEIAEKIGIKEYKVCRCLNDKFSLDFVL